MGCAASVPATTSDGAHQSKLPMNNNNNNSNNTTAITTTNETTNKTHTQEQEQQQQQQQGFFPNREGQRVPYAEFVLRKDNKFVTVTTNDLFPPNKRIVVFSLPGAFTPTCTTSHVPRYNELAPALKQYARIDEVLCISVNDSFVMDAWKKDFAGSADRITFVADGNGKFTEAMGMLVDKEDLGFGKRSWRYSMFVEDGIIRKMFIEPREPGDPFKVSDAVTMLNYLYDEENKKESGSAATTSTATSTTRWKEPDMVTLFTKEGCPYCARAKEMLRARGIEFEEVVMNSKAGITSRTVRAVSGASTVPQVFINGKLIGGSEALEKYLQEASKEM